MLGSASFCSYSSSFTQAQVYAEMLGLKDITEKIAEGIV